MRIQEILLLKRTLLETQFNFRRNLNYSLFIFGEKMKQDNKTTIILKHTFKKCLS